MFEKYILKLEKLKEKFGFEYPEKCQSKINKIGKVLFEKQLLSKYQDKDFGMQLLMANEVPEKYWKVKVGSEVFLTVGICQGAKCKVTKIQGSTIWLKSHSFCGKTHKFDIDAVSINGL